jgi:hypothetical protein
MESSTSQRNPQVGVEPPPQLLFRAHGVEGPQQRARDSRSGAIDGRPAREKSEEKSPSKSVSASFAIARIARSG